jgi:hypothetical protein
VEQDDDRLPAALTRLVGRGVLDRSQADAVLTEVGLPETVPVEAEPAPAPPARPGLRRVFGEIAGYLGASFVIGATLLFLSEEWESLGRSGRFVILAAMAVILFCSGVAVRLRAADDVRRRLASTLMTAAAAASGFATFAGLDFSGDEVVPLAATLVGLTVVTGGYLLAASAVGHLGIAAGAFAVCASVLNLFDADDILPYGLGMMGLGLLWTGLAAWRVVREHRLGLAVAVTYGLAGAQMLLFGGGDNFLAYALTALVAAACFAAYVQIREWVVLAGGVIGATVVVPEFLYDVTDGSLGASGVLLVAGVTLLGGSLIGLRIRRTA